MTEKEKAITDRIAVLKRELFYGGSRDWTSFEAMQTEANALKTLIARLEKLLEVTKFIKQN